jgi:glycosyltransferase involved in cell wall biosynthesis
MNNRTLQSTTISVIIPCFRQAHFLPFAVDSVLRQTHKAFEVVIVDDGSPDQTGEIASGYGNLVKYIRKPNGGLASARNAGLAHATGDLVQFLDADDYLMPNMHEHILAATLRFPNGTAFYGKYIEVDENANPITASILPYLGKNVFHRLLRGNPLPCHCLVIRRQAFPEPQKAFDTELGACEDWDAWLRLAIQGAVFVPVEEAMVAYRRYSSSMSSNPCLMWRTGRSVLARHATSHGLCSECRKALVSGRRACDSFFYPILEEMARLLLNGELSKSLKIIQRHVGTYPQRLLVFLWDEIRHIRNEARSRFRIKHKQTGNTNIIS